MKNVWLIVGVGALVAWAYLTGRTPQEAVGDIFKVAVAPGLFVIKTPLVAMGVWPWFEGWWLTVPIIPAILVSIYAWAIPIDVAMCLMGKELTHPNKKYRWIERKIYPWRPAIRNFRNRNRVR